MHEFSLGEKGTDLVLCVIYKKNKKTEEMGLSLERPSVADSVVLGSPKSVIDWVDFFDGIDDTGMGVKTHMMIKTNLMKIQDLLPFMIIRNSKCSIHKKEPRRWVLKLKDLIKTRRAWSVNHFHCLLYILLLLMTCLMKIQDLLPLMLMIICNFKFWIHKKEPRRWALTLMDLIKRRAWTVNYFQCFVDFVDAQDLFDENPRFAALDDHSQFQVMDSQEGTKKMDSEIDGLDQEKGMDYLPLPLSFIDFLDDHYPFDENLSPAAPNDQEEITEKMAYAVVIGIDEAEMEDLYSILQMTQTCILIH